MSEPLVGEVQIQALITERQNILARMPDVDKAVAAKLIPPERKQELENTLGRIEGILRVYKPDILSPSARPPRR